MSIIKVVNEGSHSATMSSECGCNCDCGLCRGCGCSGAEDLFSSRTGGQITMATQSGGAWHGGAGEVHAIMG